MSVKRIGT